MRQTDPVLFVDSQLPQDMGNVYIPVWKSRVEGVPQQKIYSVCIQIGAYYVGEARWIYFREDFIDLFSCDAWPRSGENSSQLGIRVQNLLTEVFMVERRIVRYR